MRKDAADLGIEYADQLATDGNLEAKQLLDGQAPGMFLVHRRHVIEAVEIRNGLQVGLVFNQLLGAAVQQSDMRVDACADLAIEFKHEAQHAVGRRMLRPEVDREIADG